MNRVAPTKSYTAELLEHYFANVDCMASYSNTLGVLVGTCVVNSLDSIPAATILRAVTRDVKRYMKMAAEILGQRVLPVGYSTDALEWLLPPTFRYMSGGDQEEAVDFFCVRISLYKHTAVASLTARGCQINKFIWDDASTHRLVGVCPSRKIRIWADERTG